MTDPAANPVAGSRVDYAPYGNATPGQRFGFTDQESDDESGLIYMDARYYEPTLGRMLSADTVIPDLYNPQSLNRYSYVLNNPIMYNDPSGHSYEGDWYNDPESSLGVGLDTVDRTQVTDTWGMDLTDVGRADRLTNSGEILERPTNLGELLENRSPEEVLLRLKDDVPDLPNSMTVEYGGMTERSRTYQEAQSLNEEMVSAMKSAAWQGVGLVGGIAAGKLLPGLVSATTRAAVTPLTKSDEIGKFVIGWGIGQTPKAVAQTKAVTQGLTSASVKSFAQQGVTRQWVAKQLAKYSASTAKAGRKLENTQLEARTELMQRILELWPK